MSNVKFKIVEVHPQEHSVVVRFYTDRITEDMLAVDIDPMTRQIRRCRTDYNINLPVPAPTGAELDAFLSRFAPVEWLRTMEAVLDPAVDTSLDSIPVGVERIVTLPEFPATSPDAGITLSEQTA